MGQCIQGKRAENDDGKKEREREKLGKEGKRLLWESVQRTGRENVTKSCTIDIGQSGKRRCVVDDGRWSGCDVSWFYMPLNYLLMRLGRTRCE